MCEGERDSFPMAGKIPVVPTQPLFVLPIQEVNEKIAQLERDNAWLKCELENLGKNHERLVRQLDSLYEERTKLQIDLTTHQTRFKIAMDFALMLAADMASKK